MNTISSGSDVSHIVPSATPNEGCTKKNKRPKMSRKVTTSDLAKAYISSMKIVGQKTMVKMFVGPI